MSSNPVGRIALLLALAELAAQPVDEQHEIRMVPREPPELEVRPEHNRRRNKSDRKRNKRDRWK